MDIVDCYCGLGPWQKRDRLLPYRTDDIVRLMDHFGIRRAVAHSNYTEAGGDCARGNALLARACGESDRFVPAFTIEPYPYDSMPSVADQFAAMRAAGAKALWLYLRKTPLASWLHGELLSGCVAYRLPVLLPYDHITPHDVHRICSDFPSLRLILVGLSYREDVWLYPLLRKFESLHVCTGYVNIPPYGPMRFLEHFPAERLLFGSGLPHFSPGGMVAHLMYGRMPDKDREKIMGGNIKRLLAEATL